MPRQLKVVLGGTAFKVGLFTLIAAVLWFGASTGMVFEASPAEVWRRVAHADWPWLVGCLGGVVVAYAGYAVAYEGVAGAGARRFGARDLTAIVATGFGGFMLTGGNAVDLAALRGADQSDRNARVRLMLLHQFEQLPIGVAALVSSIVLLAAGSRSPGPDFTVPWVIGVPLGAIVVLGGAWILKDRFRRSRGVRRWLGIAVDSLRMLAEQLASPRYAVPRVGGMALYWAGEVFAVWCAVATFGYRMAPATAIVAYATGYALTRRTVPVGGAGLIDVLLPLSLWAAGVPLSAAVAGVIAYRMFNFWLALPPALLALPRLRSVVGPVESKPALVADILVGQASGPGEKPVRAKASPARAGH